MTESFFALHNNGSMRMSDSPQKSATPEPWELLAIRYATHSGRRQSENFIGGDPHEAGADLDYYIWVARQPSRVFVIDTGFGAQQATLRKRTLHRLPAAGLGLLGIDAATVEDVILTHLHYDHAGTLDAFPRARFHAQDAEMAFATGRCMCEPSQQHAYHVEDVVALVRHVYAGRVCFHEGTAELAPGLSVHHVGGHTAGLQCVRVWTRRGHVVVASDASHLYLNMRERAPFPIVYSIPDMLAGHDLVHRLADSPDHVIPGHDPLVMERYPAPTPALAGIAVRLDVAPLDVTRGEQQA
jgi:glyoxylase-like metal-dependent hydrolase (beta-lactamase superfamily II)